MSDARAIPFGRLARLARIGALASGVARGVLSEGARQLAQGKRPVLGQLVLTPANARRVADQLSQLRGAAMKVGQLLSMDAGELLPPELSQILARLRNDARPMPMSQLVAVLNAEWGEGWEKHFPRFSFTPMAAASIGQVHAATTVDGRRLAIKVQYPGVRESIDCDVDNVATLLRLSGLLPSGLALAPLLDEAKRQLHLEADYVCEAEHLASFGALLAGRGGVALPEVDPEFTRPGILAMSYLDGEPIESLAAAPQPVRDDVAARLFALMFEELLVFRRVQTDPNFANYRFDAPSGRVVLLDFGAVRAYGTATAEAYLRLMRAARRANRAGVEAAACDIGYFKADIAAHHRQAVVELFMTASEPLRHDGPYDFGQTTLLTRISELGMALGRDRSFWHTPPVDALFLHRKLGGLYLLASRLKARVDFGELFAPYQ
ncbi:AarF/ABC1/UbiB kinase family protein [Denitromonas sp.]|uniref:ABC1 kinase family protein n=1 Tax=Denitromonas sp. TaxID=2734609 RepID=UPI002AFE74D5|nr:AarF/ABC1/UbiB kinase family protein [Denitromonas sp.]